MTMAELHSLYEQYFPAAPPQLRAVGQGSVTSPGNVTPLHFYGQKTVTAFKCPICGNPIWGNLSKVYCSPACKQAAYRQRKKAGK